MAAIIQVGVGSGGMAVLDLVIREPQVTEITLIEPDRFEADNVGRHLLGYTGVGRAKVELAAEWVRDHRPDIEIRTLSTDLCAGKSSAAIDEIAARADIGICAVDNETAKYAWDDLMRRHTRPWTLGEVLSGGIGGFVHWFAPGNACYGCVAGHLQRAVTIDDGKAPDYSQPDGGMAETKIPASRAAISAIASLHALVTLALLKRGPDYAPGFTSLLFSLEPVGNVFPVAFKPYRFQIPRSPDCLICGRADLHREEDVDVAVNDALARLGQA
jgi:molybdopterin/thiamine biosynthesis adenylyltransferase